MSEISGMKHLKLSLAFFIIAVWVGFLYFNSLGNQFTNWDDGMVYQNSIIRNLNWDTILKIFAYEKASTYQPIRMLSYAVDYQFWKLNPTGYRITNIFFYILTCILIFLTARRLSINLRERSFTDSHNHVAIFSSLLFAAHPVHVEAVTWLAARKEVLQGFFFFLAFFLYLKGREEGSGKRIIYLSLVLFSVLLAILSKPSAIVFPAVILIYEIAQQRNRWVGFIRNHWLFLMFLLFISIVFTFILIKVMLDAGGIKPYRGGSFSNNIVISFYALLYHIKLLVSTANYSAAYTIDIPTPIWGSLTLIFIGITLLLFGISVWSFKRTRVVFFSFFFFVVTVLPYLNIIPISTLLADRYVFIASFSFCFLLGIGLDKLYRLKSKRFTEGFFKLISVVIFLFLLVGYSAMTIRQNQIWENSYTLWADAVEKYPGSNTANALMGVVYMGLGMDEKAVEYLEKAIQILPYDYQSRNNLGIVYGRLKQPEKALKELKTAIFLRPDDDKIKINLSIFYQRQKEYVKSEDILTHLLSKSPQNANLHFRLGMLYRDAERYEDAISELKNAMKLAPHVVNPYEEIGNIYLCNYNDKEKATYYYSEGIENAPKAKSRIEDLRWIVQDIEK